MMKQRNLHTVSQLYRSLPLVSYMVTAGIAAMSSAGITPDVFAQTISAPQIQTTPEVSLDSTPNSAQYQIISPSVNEMIDNISTTVVLQYPQGSRIDLRVNGRSVDPSSIGKTETNNTLKLVTETWYGVILEEGPNAISLYPLNGDEAIATTEVTVRGRPTQLRLKTAESKVPADGLSTATVVGEALDEYGNRTNREGIITLNTSAGEFIGTDENENAPGFQVKLTDGQFTAQIKSPLDAQSARIRATLNNLEAYHQFQFTTALRKKQLLTGTVDVRFGRRGLNFSDSLKDFLPVDGKKQFQLDASAQGFGVGSIGEWSIIGAFNTERGLNTDCEGKSTLFRAQGSECSSTLYPAYGDNSQSDIVAPSTDQVYLKLERSSQDVRTEPDSFLWGDYLTTPELSRRSQRYSATSRSLHGFKGNYNLGDLQVTGIYGKDVNGFQRDTIAPDGTRGYYFLSRRLLVPGTEQIFLELEELNRPGTVLERVQLQRGADYEIDYDRGSILFREAINRTDLDANGTILVQRIIATYDFEGEDQDSNTHVYGGRVQYNLNKTPDRETWLGASYFKEDKGDQDFELWGADALVSFGKDGVFIAEYAQSENSLNFTDKVKGEAYQAELSGTLLDRLQGEAFYRHTSEGFSNNATTSFVPGQTRYGAKLRFKASNHTSLRASYDHEDNFGVAPLPLDNLESILNPGLEPEPGQPLDNSLTTIRAGIQQKIGKAKLSADWVRRDRTDRLRDSQITTDQLSSLLTLPITSKLQLTARNDFTLSSEEDPLYPTRTSVGLDWRALPGLTVGLNQSFLDGGQFDNDWLTSLDLKGEHTFKTDTTLKGQVSVLGDRAMAGRLGIGQGIKITRDLKLDLEYEHVFNMPFKRTAAGEQSAQPFAVGAGGSSIGLTSGDSFSAGLSYNPNPDLQANAGVDYRSNQSGTNLVISANALGKFTPSLTGVGQFKMASAANQGLEELGNSMDVKVGLAYRNPNNDKFNALLRYEYRKNPSIIPETLLFGRGTGSEDHLGALEAIYAPNWRWEFYGKAGVRHSKSYLAQDFVGRSTIGLGQLRAIYRFDYRWDVGAEFRYIGQPTANYHELGASAEVGYHLNPNLRLAVGYAFGEVSDRDFSGYRSANGPFIGFTLKLDNNLLKDFGFGKKRPKKAKKNQLNETASEVTEAAKDVTSREPVSTNSKVSPQSTQSQNQA